MRACVVVVVVVVVVMDMGEDRRRDETVVLAEDEAKEAAGTCTSVVCGCVVLFLEDEVGDARRRWHLRYFFSFLHWFNV